MAAPSWLATQPPTPMTTDSLCRLRSFQRPSWLNTFSCAFSRIEQVLMRMTSASASLSVTTRPCAAPRTSAILAESYSFIWQPWVFMYSFPVIGTGELSVNPVVYAQDLKLASGYGALGPVFPAATAVADCLPCSMIE